MNNLPLELVLRPKENPRKVIAPPSILKSLNDVSKLSSISEGTKSQKPKPCWASNKYLLKPHVKETHPLIADSHIILKSSIPSDPRKNQKVFEEVQDRHVWINVVSRENRKRRCLEEHLGGEEHVAKKPKLMNRNQSLEEAVESYAESVGNLPTMNFNSVHGLIPLNFASSHACRELRWPCDATKNGLTIPSITGPKLQLPLDAQNFPLRNGPCCLREEPLTLTKCSPDDIPQPSTQNKPSRLGRDLSYRSPNLPSATRLNQPEIGESPLTYGPAHSPSSCRGEKRKLGNIESACPTSSGITFTQSMSESSISTEPFDSLSSNKNSSVLMTSPGLMGLSPVTFQPLEWSRCKAPMTQGSKRSKILLEERAKPEVEEVNPVISGTEESARKRPGSVSTSMYATEEAAGGIISGESAHRTKEVNETIARGQRY
ncbi:uncharacterized protein F5891DRAFT_981913 [Suillus fuscotomentosus]|uniref:Uncharacterized protein n=1 Tax=Suillus fuscotomentosus TaxID=1912939 RepID=A0AAD4HJB0_9AGAM|nr:uncharacterized protein F5891DRAFT_981913 [Suillus fuscotomentosus]KAG1898256.1 hypothetical protein F5891DRAFT_981913 [Suillus fuscotomentosus]